MKINEKSKNGNILTVKLALKKFRFELSWIIQKMTFKKSWIVEYFKLKLC